jgi:hypothetical protein
MDFQASPRGGAEADFEAPLERYTMLSKRNKSSLKGLFVKKDLVVLMYGSLG